MNISFSYNNALSTEAISQYQEAVKSAHNELVQGTGLGNDFFCFL